MSRSTAHHPRLPHALGNKSGEKKKSPRSTLERIFRCFATCFTGTQSRHSNKASRGNPQTPYNHQIPEKQQPRKIDCQYGGPHYSTRAGSRGDVQGMPPMTNTWYPSHPRPELSQQVYTTPPEVSPGEEIIIALMGATGAGKSYFIKKVSGNSEVVVSHNLYSCTAKVQSYSFEYGGARITLVDTPGFNDTNRSDIEVLQEIADWASATYRENRLLSGIIYLHPITHARMRGSALKNLRMFQSLCGQKALSNVFLTTTQWSNVNPAEGGVRENSLQNPDFWGGLIDRGATIQRFHGTRESGLELIRKLMPKERKSLDIQVQIVNQGKTLLETDAGKWINKELIAQEKKHKEEIESLKRDIEEVVKGRDNEMKEILSAEQEKARKNLEKVVSERRLLAELRAAGVKARSEGEGAGGNGEAVVA